MQVVGLIWLVMVVALLNGVLLALLCKGLAQLRFQALVFL